MAFIIAKNDHSLLKIIKTVDIESYFNSIINYFRSLLSIFNSKLDLKIKPSVSLPKVEPVQMVTPPAGEELFKDLIPDVDFDPSEDVRDTYTKTTYFFIFISVCFLAGSIYYNWDTISHYLPKDGPSNGPDLPKVDAQTSPIDSSPILGEALQGSVNWATGTTPSKDSINIPAISSPIPTPQLGITIPTNTPPQFEVESPTTNIEMKTIRNVSSAPITPTSFISKLREVAASLHDFNTGSGPDSGSNSDSDSVSDLDSNSSGSATPTQTNTSPPSFVRGEVNVNSDVLNLNSGRIHNYDPNWESSDSSGFIDQDIVNMDSSDGPPTQERFNWMFRLPESDPFAQV